MMGRPTLVSATPNRQAAANHDQRMTTASYHDIPSRPRLFTQGFDSTLTLPTLGSILEPMGEPVQLNTQIV